MAPKPRGKYETHRLRLRDEAKRLASEFIKDARSYANQSLQQLAVDCNVSKGYLSQAESIHSDMKVPIDFLLLVSEVTKFPFRIQR